MHRRISIFLLTALTAAVSLTLCLVALSLGWFGPFENAGCRFCERMRPGIIKQPANTWSNLGFVAAGLSMAWSLAMGRFQANRNALTENAGIATGFSCLAVLLGPGSMAMHASGAHWGGFLDVLSMYLVASFLVAYSVRRVFRFKAIWIPVVFAIVFAGAQWAKQLKGIKLFTLSFGNLVFAGCLVSVLVLESVALLTKRVRHATAWGWGSLASILLAFFIWNMSLTGNAWCDPDSMIQGHAIWHLLDALSVYCVFRHYVSENEPMAADSRG